MLPLRRVLGGEGRTSPFWVHIFIRGSTMETPTNNHQLFTITKIKRFAQTGLLAASGIFLSSGVFIYRAEAQSLRCGQSENQDVIIAGRTVSYAAHTIDGAKKGAENLAEEAIAVNAATRSEAIAKELCPNTCPGIIDEDSMKVQVTFENVISAFFDKDMKKQFLEECENVTAIEGEKKGDDRKILCEKTYKPSALHDPTAFVAYSSGKGRLTFGVTCPREIRRWKDQDVKPSSSPVRIGRPIG
jgi:hypothetical protein